jgi:hypothetical protein
MAGTVQLAGWLVICLMSISFRVGARVGHKISARPFGRLDISADELRVWCWPVAWFKPRSVSRETITEIIVDTKFSRPFLKIHDTEGRFENVLIDLVGRAGRISHELRRHGYQVADRRASK